MSSSTSTARALYFDDLELGQEYVTRGRTVTESDITLFAGWSWDTNPVHTDEVVAGGTPFGTRVAHGLIGLSMAMGLISRLDIFDDAAQAFLSIDEWRFLAPLRPGTTIHCVVEVVTLRPTSDGRRGVVARRLSVKDQSGALLQQGVVTVLMHRKPE
ncbi:MaoC/PaaZ C-terminal domain-containing protein [Kribbia dieselivorans]|uniref:MaoC/PaaZ C-terminal domain-containing protein n=1 Tax=Kribbia dieselivorans TaxID=331526 RepID=UPI0008380A30|nr:MaoC/PaaZ C-terminal domain-containing protein [Kribbia dieselivorans]